jgi:uncharacterized membrane protein YkvA (DUF1232 family)
MAKTRWGMFRTLAIALRTATRPGSAGLGERLGAVPRLVRATVRGDYRGTTTGRLLMIAAGLAYVVSPIDLVPDFLTLLGLADDAVVVTWVAAALVNETESFLAWERSPQGVRPNASSPQGDTVPGHVVR